MEDMQAVIKKMHDMGNWNKNKILKLLKKKKGKGQDKFVENLILLGSILQHRHSLEKDIVEYLETFLEDDSLVLNQRQKVALCFAIKNRKRDVMDFFMRSNAKMSNSDQQGNTITHFFVVIEKEKLRLLKLDVHSYHQEIPTSKFQEMESDSVSFIEWLIEKGADFDRKNEEGKNALHLSIEYNVLHILLVLLKHTRNVYSVDKHNKTLLYFFFQRCAKYRIKNLEGERINRWYYVYHWRYLTRIVQILLDRALSDAAHVNDGRTPLGMENEETACCHSQNSSATTALLEVLKSCAWWGDSSTKYCLNVLYAMIAKGANVNGRAKEGITPLYCAFWGKNRDALDLLNDYGDDFSAITDDGETLFHANVDGRAKEGITPIYCAFWGKHRGAVDLLNDYGADFSAITDDGENLFHALARKPDPYESCDKSTDEEKLNALFELIVSKGCCDVNAKGRDDKAPLHIACRWENLAIIRKLIEHGADVDCKCEGGKTPLHIAIDFNVSEEVIELLLESGASANSKDSSGRRQLDYAVERYAPLSLLLKWGACVNVYDDGGSPFSKAIQCDSFSIAEEMLMYGADINDERIINSAGESGTLFDYERPKTRILRLLMEHWIKLDAAKLPRLKNYEGYVRRVGYQHLYEDCFAEIKKLQCTYIDSCTSLYAFLHMDLGTRRTYINGEEMKKLVDCPNLEEQFPQYFVLILASYHETVTWKLLLEPAKRALLELTDIALPDVCSELIFGYLSNQDLVSMIDHDDNV